jgi:hypothetical protein
MALEIQLAINPDLYGTLPQLAWFEGLACVPTSVTNALVGLARQDGLTTLMSNPADPFSYESILNTRNDLAQNYYYTSSSWDGARSITPEGEPPGEKTNTAAGSPASLTLSGLAKYFEQRGLRDDIQIEAIGYAPLGGFGVESTQPIGDIPRKTPPLDAQIFQEKVKFTQIDNEEEDPRKMFSFMMISLMRGALIFGGFYNQEKPGGHALLATGFKIDDRNSDGKFDTGESELTVIDPLNPATEYSPTINDKTNPVFVQTQEQFNNAIKPGNTPKFLKGAITISTEPPPYLSDINPFNMLAFEYYQESIGINTPNYLPPEGGLPEPLPIGFFGGDSSNGITSQETSQDPKAFNQKMNIALAMSIHTKPLPYGLDATVSTNSANTPALYNLSSLIDRYDTITGYLYTNESSDYANNLLFYSALDESGLIEDPLSGNRLTPADTGYIAAAKALADELYGSTKSNSIQSIENIKQTIEFDKERVSRDFAQLEGFTLNLNGLRGAFLAPLVTTSNGETWVPFAEATIDGQQHFMNTGILGWRVEDTYKLGDRDFNDLHTQLIITELA